MGSHLRNPYVTQRLRMILYVVVAWPTTYKTARLKKRYFARVSMENAWAYHLSPERLRRLSNPQFGSMLVD